MTENEAIQFLKGKYPSWGCDEDEYEQAQTAIQALEEIQQYRAIGTVKQIRIKKAEFELLSKRYLDDLGKLMEYQKIGTIVEFKDLKEKSVAKKPRFYAHNYHCIACGNLVGNNEFEWQRFLYCDRCGQKLDWSE